MRSHSEGLGIRTLAYEFGRNTIEPKKDIKRTPTQKEDLLDLIV